MWVDYVSRLGIWTSDFERTQTHTDSPEVQDDLCFLPFSFGTRAALAQYCPILRVLIAGLGLNTLLIDSYCDGGALREDPQTWTLKMCLDFSNCSMTLCPLFNF